MTSKHFFTIRSEVHDKDQKDLLEGGTHDDKSDHVIKSLVSSFVREVLPKVPASNPNNKKGFLEIIEKVFYPLCDKFDQKFSEKGEESSNLVAPKDIYLIKLHLSSKLDPKNFEDIIKWCQEAGIKIEVEENLKVGLCQWHLFKSEVKTATLENELDDEKIKKWLTKEIEDAKSVISDVFKSFSEQIDQNTLSDDTKDELKDNLGKYESFVSNIFKSVSQKMDQKTVSDHIKDKLKDL